MIKIMKFGRAGTFRRTSSFSDELRHSERPSCCDSFWACLLNDYIDDETFATMSVFVSRDPDGFSTASSADVLKNLERKGRGQIMKNLPKAPSLADPKEYKLTQSADDIIAKIQRLEKKVARSRSKSKSRTVLGTSESSRHSRSFVPGPESSYAGEVDSPRVTRRPIPTDAEREREVSNRRSRSGIMRRSRSSTGLSITPSRSGLDPVGSTDGTVSAHSRRSIYDRELPQYEERSSRSLRSIRTFEPPRPEEPREPEPMEYGTSSRPLVIAEDEDDFAPSERSRGLDERDMPIAASPSRKSVSHSMNFRKERSYNALGDDEVMLQTEADSKGETLISQRRKEERRAALQRIRAIKERLGAVQ